MITQENWIRFSIFLTFTKFLTGKNMQPLNLKIVINGKIFYNKLIDSDIKQYKEIRKLKQIKMKIIPQNFVGL